MRMKISELFFSIQGEGKLSGVPSAFVRTSGCNLRCTWCDTPYASWNADGREMSVDEIRSAVREHGTQHVVLTGGEPAIAADVAELCEALKADGMHITLETAATIYKPLRIDLASLSPKLSNSTPHAREAGRFAAAHEKQRLKLSTIQQFIDSAPEFQLKFVLSSERDLEEIQSILEHLRGWRPADVLLMPEGIDQARLAERALWIIDICKRSGFRYCPRLHIEIFGNKRGT